LVVVVGRWDGAFGINGINALMHKCINA
jgi:hypothetical protein